MSQNNENKTAASIPEVAAKDKAIPNKVLYISFTKDCPYTTEGKYVVFSYDLLNDVTYEIAAELAFLVREVEIPNKLALLLDFRNERPDDYETLRQSIQRDIIAPLLQASVPEEVIFHFPDSYIEWLVYNTDQIRAEIGRSLRQQDNAITLYTSDIFKEYVENGIITKIKKIAEENPEITNFSVIDTDLEKGPMLDALTGLKADWIYRPFHENWIQAELGYMYANGIGVSKDPAKAIPFYTTAAEKGNIYAMNNLGYMYQHGQGVTANGTKAFELYLKAAEQEHAYGMANVGYCYHTGTGTPKDLDQAASWYEKAAEKGVDFAQHNLAMIAYDKGDYDVAFKWYHTLAENNSYHQRASILYWVGYMYKEGLGVTKQGDYAYSYLAKASDLGFDAAHRLCAELTANGFGVFGGGTDIERTKMYYNRGRKAGDLESNIQMAKFLMGLQKDEATSREILAVLKEVFGKSPEAICMYITYMRENPETLDKNEMDEAVKELSHIADQYPPAKTLWELIEKEKAEERKKLEEEERRIQEEQELIRKKAMEQARQAQLEREASQAKWEEEKRQRALREENAVRCYSQTLTAIKLVTGNETNMDLVKGAKMLVASSRAGDPLAKAWLGYLLLSFDPNQKNAFDLVSSAVYKYHRDFYYLIAGYYISPAHHNSKKNIEFLQKQTPGDCYAILGTCYLNGWGTKKNLDKAHALFKSAMDRDSGLGYTMMGLCYQSGIGVVQDLKAAEKYYDIAQRYNQGLACNNLALIEMNSVTGNGIRIRRLFERAATYGCTVGMCNWGDILASGNDKAGAEQWYRKAIIESLGDQQLIQYATKQLKAIGGRVPEWKPTPFTVYFENGVPTMQKPASYIEPTPAVKEPDQNASKNGNNNVNNDGTQTSLSDTLKSAKNALKDAVDSITENTKGASEKGGFFKRLFGRNK